MEHAALARLDRQRNAGGPRERGRADAGGVDHGSASDARAVVQLHLVDAMAAALEADDGRFAVGRAQCDRLAPKAAHQRIGIEPAFAGQAERAGGEVVGREPRKALAQLGWIEQRHIGAEIALNAVIACKRIATRGTCEEQVAAFVKPDFGRFAVNAQMLADVPNEFSAELRKANVLGRRELMADRRGGQRGGAALIAEVLLDHQHRAAKARLGGEKVSRRAADGGAADDHDIEPFHHLARLC